MKTNRFIPIAVMLLIVMTLGTIQYAFAEDTGNTVPGTVTMPLDSFLHLNNPAHPTATPKPVSTLPVKFIFTHGSYDLYADSRNTKIEGTISFILYQSGWTEIPLIPSSMTLGSARLDGRELPLYVKDGKYHFLAKGAGDHSLRLSIYVSNTANGNTRSSSFTLPQTTVSTMNAVVAASGVQVTLSPAIITSLSSTGDKTMLQATIPPSEGALAISWTPKKVLPQFVKKNPEARPKLYSVIDTLLSINQDTLKAVSTINYSILYNKVDTFHFQIPEDVSITNITGNQFLKWEKSSKKDGTIITVYLTDKVEGNYALTVEYEKPIAKINSTWELPVLQLLGVERQTGTIGCYPEDNIEVTMTGLQGAYQIDEKELPATTRDAASKPILLAFKYQTPPYQISLETRKLEELPVLTTTIDAARAITVVNDEGTALTTITYTMRNNQKQYLELAMPPKSRLLSSFVNNAPVKPIKGEKNQVKIPLLRSKGSGENDSFTLEISFISDLGSFGSLEAKEALAPACAVPISEYHWSLFLPKEERILKFAGNMKPTTQATVTIARREAATDDSAAPAPSAVVMQEKSCKAECAKDEGITIRRDRAQKEYEQQAIVKMDKIVAQNSTGLNPIRIYIPEAGNIYRFNKLLVIDQSPKIVAYLYKSWIHSLMLFSLCGLTLIAGLAIVSRGAQKAHATMAAAYLVALFALRAHIGEFFTYGITGLVIVFALWIWKTYSLQILDALKTLPVKRQAMAVK